jgi:hypothetical protein
MADQSELVVSFELCPDQMGQGRAALRLIFCGFDIAPAIWNFQESLVYVRLELEEADFTCSWSDLLRIEQLEDLALLLDDFQKQVRGAGQFLAHERGFQLSFSLDEGRSDVVIRGEIPSADYEAFWRFYLSEDPLLFRKRIKTSDTFEFWMEPSRLAAPLDQLMKVLHHAASLRRGTE